MGITLDELDAGLHSIAIKDSVNGYELDIDSNGYITAKVNGSVAVTATDLDIRNLASSQDSVEIKTAAGQALAIDASGFLTITNSSFAVTQSTSPWVVSGAVSTTPVAYDTWKVSAEAASDVEAELVSTPLTGRLKIMIQNLGANDVYIAPATGVSVANGLKIAKGSIYEADLDAAANIFAICATGQSADLRVVEYSV